MGLRARPVAPARGAQEPMGLDENTAPAATAVAVYT